MCTLVKNFVQKLPENINYTIFADSAFGGLNISIDLLKMPKRFAAQCLVNIFTNIKFRYFLLMCKANCPSTVFSNYLHKVTPKKNWNFVSIYQVTTQV